MQIPLNQFESYIDETILNRGKSYFKNNHVNEPQELSTGLFEAIVEGTDDYVVQLRIDKNIIVEYGCSCPYDMGPVCKHVVALIYYLQRDFLDIKQKTTITNPKKQKKSTKRKTVFEQVEGILQKVSVNELKKFIQDTAEHDSAFRNIFLATFAHQNEEETKGLYSKHLNSILRKSEGRYGFIDWAGTSQISSAVNELLRTAEQHIENKNYKSGIYICTAVIEKMTEIIEHTDDSSGHIGDCIYQAMELLRNISLIELSEKIRTLLFDYCLDSYEKGIFEGWDWHNDMLDIALEMLKNDNEAQRMMNLLDKIPESEYEKQYAQNIKLEILRRTKGEEVADLFLEQNLSNNDFRKKAIMKSIENKNYERAIFLANEGIEQDKKDKPGYVKDWYNLLLKIAQAQKDIKKIIEYARYLFIDNFSNEQDYYSIMKSNIQPENWNDFVEKIINDLEKKANWRGNGLITKIFINEEWWSRLFEKVKQDPSLHSIEEFEKYLSKSYANDLAELYEIEIKKYVKHNMGRNHYQTACRYLRRMIKLGARAKANELIEFLRKEYPKRKALMEELNKV